MEPSAAPTGTKRPGHGFLLIHKGGPTEPAGFLRERTPSVCVPEGVGDRSIGPPCIKCLMLIDVLSGLLICAVVVIVVSIVTSRMEKKR